MKRLAASAAAFCLLALLVSRPAYAQNNANCTDTLIQGSYGFTLEGEKLGPPGTPTGPLR